MKSALINGLIFDGFHFIDKKIVLIDQEKIAGIVDEKTVHSSDVIWIDCHNQIIAPGLIDLQVYGGGGVLFSNNPSREFLAKMSTGLMENGTTSFLLTLATNSLDIFRRAIQVIKKHSDENVLGLHFEGPYLNPKKSGAHLKEYIRKPQKEEILELLNDADGALKMMTIAPELFSNEIIRLLLANKVVVSAGHSDATFEEAKGGFRQGITTATHLFNAMSSLHHRQAGLPGAIFNSNKICSSIIPDGIHVDFEILKMSKRLMGERLFIITDAVEESSGPYVHVKRSDRYTLPDGTLSGSRLTQFEGVKNCVRHAEIPLGEALRMASLYPARIIGADHLGKISAGASADLIVFDEDFKLGKVIKNGKIVKESSSGNYNKSLQHSNLNSY